MGWKPNVIISIDCESNGLEGEVFAVAAIAYSTERMRAISEWTCRCPVAGPIDPWVEQNVLPVLDDPKTGIPVTVDTYQELCSEWRKFYEPFHRWGANHALVGHMVWPVETRFLSDAHHGEVMSTGPYPLIDVAGALAAFGYDPTSVDRYLERWDRQPDGPSHHPLNDASAALRAWLFLTGYLR